MKQVIKRDGREVPFDSSRIKTAILKANKSVEEADRILEENIDEIVKSVVFDIGEGEKIDIEKIQDAVEEELMKINGKVAKAFILFREERNKARRNTIDDTIKETGAINSVTATVFDFRGYDTLGEAIVLFTAICGVAAVLRPEKKAKEEK